MGRPNSLGHVFSSKEPKAPCDRCGIARESATAACGSARKTPIRTPKDKVLTVKKFKDKAETPKAIAVAEAVVKATDAASDQPVHEPLDGGDIFSPPPPATVEAANVVRA